MAKRFSKNSDGFASSMAIAFYALSLIVSLASALAKNPLDLTLSDESSEDSPLLIEADQGTTCDQKAHTCTATGNVKVTKGQFHLECQKLVVVYRDSTEGLAQKKREIERIKATGNARFTGKPGEKALAPRIVYNLSTREVVLDNPDYKAPELKRGRYPSLKEIAALPRVIKDQNLLSAPKLTLFLNVDSHGKHAIERIKADGRVLISTPDEIAFGNDGIYEPKQQRATLQGEVIITHEPKPRRQTSLKKSSGKTLSNASSIKNKDLNTQE